MINLTNTSDWLAEKIAAIEDEQGNAKFQLLGDNLGGKGLPLVAWRLKKEEPYDGLSFVHYQERYAKFKLPSRVRGCPDLAFSRLDWCEHLLFN